MEAKDIVRKLITALAQLEVPYMLVGSLSTNAYGVTRSTKDADAVIELGSRTLQEIVAMMGDEFVLDPQPSFESITMTVRHEIRHRVSPFIVELFLLSDDAHDQARFGRRTREQYEGLETWIPSAEDVVVTKLRWAVRSRRPKDREDVLHVLGVQAGKLDMSYIRQWTDAHGSTQLLNELLAELDDLKR